MLKRWVLAVEFPPIRFSQDFQWGGVFNKKDDRPSYPVLGRLGYVRYPLCSNILAISLCRWGNNENVRDSSENPLPRNRRNSRVRHRPLSRSRATDPTVAVSRKSPRPLADRSVVRWPGVGNSTFSRHRSKRSLEPIGTHVLNYYR